MASQQPLTIKEIASALQTEEMRSLVKYFVSHRLRTGDIIAIRKVAAHLVGEADRLKRALFYLETATWDAQHALFQIELDTKDKEDTWSIAENDGYPAENQIHNIDFQRDLISPGAEVNEAMFEITYRTDVTESATVVISDDFKQRFDINDPDQVEDLDRWRRSMTWHLIGPEKGLGHGQGEKWHPLQETFVRNRFALPTNVKPDFKGIHEDYLKAFEHVILPGRVEPCADRSQTAITSYLHREVIDNYDGSPVSKSLTRDLKHMMAKSRLHKKWMAILEKATRSQGELIYEDEEED